jgi:hypothetical protein
MTFRKVRDEVLASERAAHGAPPTKAARDAFRPVDLKALTKEEAQAESQRLYRDHSKYALRAPSATLKKSCWTLAGQYRISLGR